MWKHTASESAISTIVDLLDRVLVQLAIILHDDEASDLRGFVASHISHVIRDHIQSKCQQVDARVHEQFIADSRPQELILAPDILVHILLVGSRKVQIKARQEVVHVLPGAVEAIHRVLTRYSSRQLAIKLSEQWRLCG